MKINQFFFLFAISLFSFVPHTSEITWTEIDQGLHLAEFTAPQKSFLGDSKITVLKIDPAHYELDLFSAKQKGEHTRTAKQWAAEKDLIAVVNAGMYQADYATNLGYMKIKNFVNQSRVNKDNSIAAFGRKYDSLPEVQIIDRTCQDWESLKNSYHSFTQSIRMVDCQQRNKWGQQDRRWSIVAIGMDQDGNVLFMFSRSPYSVHDFIDILLRSPLNLYNAMYLEGGPEASFYLHHKGTTRTKMGSYETDFNENDGNTVLWEIPNVIGVRKR